MLTTRHGRAACWTAPTSTRSWRSPARTRSSTCSPTTGRGPPTSSRAGSAARCGAGSPAASWSRPATSAPTWCRCSARPTTPAPSPSGRWPGAAASRPSSARTRRSRRSGTPSRARGAGRASSAGSSRTSRSAARRWSSRTPRSAAPTRADLDAALPGVRGDVHRGGRRLARRPAAARSSTARGCSQLISRGWSFARFDEGRLVFKAEVACASPYAAQIQGVYVPPDRRGQGLAIAGMAAVVALVQAARRPGGLALRQRLERARAARLRAGRLRPDRDLLHRDVLRVML